MLFSAPQPEESSGSEESDESDVESSDSECMFPVLHEEELATSSSDDDVVQFMIPYFVTVTVLLINVTVSSILGISTEFLLSFRCPVANRL